MMATVQRRPRRRMLDSCREVPGSHRRPSWPLGGPPLLGWRACRRESASGWTPRVTRIRRTPGLRTPGHFSTNGGPRTARLMASRPEPPTRCLAEQGRPDSVARRWDRARPPGVGDLTLLHGIHVHGATHRWPCSTKPHIQHALIDVIVGADKSVYLKGANAGP